ncbi:MAG: glycosyltransferase [Spirochaetales bacterium]|nr:glycosyltransferase [Spirochaetales bacterium]
MRIAFGFDIFYPETNGVITATIDLARNLIDMGHEVFFFVPDDREFKDDVIENGIKIIHIKALPTFIYKGIKIMPIWGWFLSKYFKKYNFDIIHNTSPWLMCMALNHAARRTHTPVLATHHTLIDDPNYIKYALKSDTLAKLARKPMWQIIFSPFFELVWMATAPNKQTCESVKSHMPFLDVRYVSNGIDISKFDDAVCSGKLPKAISEEWLGKKTFIYVGRLGFEKAIDVAIKAFSIAHKKHPEAKFIIVGQGPAKNELKDMVRVNDLEDSVLFTGMIPNTEVIDSRLMKRVNSFVTASLSENQSMTIIEAICSGTPVICADVYNMTSLVGPDAGWYFQPSNPEDMASKMIEALSNEEERDRKAANALKNKELYDGKKIAKQFEALYNELLERKKSGFYVKKGKEKARYYNRNFT